MQEIKITTEFITLTQLLKSESFIGSGGEAKYYLAEYPVIINGEQEDRRGRKLYVGDVIIIQDQEFIIK